MHVLCTHCTNVIIEYTLRLVNIRTEPLIEMNAMQVEMIKSSNYRCGGSKTIIQTFKRWIVELYMIQLNG